MQAVMWLVSGDVRYAANAAAIIDAWATTNTKFCGKNAPLVSPEYSAQTLVAWYMCIIPETSNEFGSMEHCQLHPPCCVLQQHHKK
jgi:hypothetical protein